MVTYRLYIEGGGRADPDPAEMDRAAMVDDNAEAFRRGWQIFFNKAGIDGQMLEIAVGGGQQEAFALFNSQLNRYVEHEETEPKPLLLVDSEEPVAAGYTVWEHLQTRLQHRFQRPANADDQSAFMMVQAMETWFVADSPALQRFFDSSLDTSVLQNSSPLEAIPKEDALDMLRQATLRCRRHYSKGRRSYGILAEIDPALVAAACPHASELLDYLHGLNP